MEEMDLLENVAQRPQIILFWLSRLCGLLRERGLIGSKTFGLLEASNQVLTDAWGGVQRIQSTPTPFAYAHHIKVFLHLYVFTLPFALLQPMGLMTPIACLWIAYALFGVDEIGVEIEEPFGEDANDLPLDDIVNEFVESSEATLQLFAEPNVTAGARRILSAPKLGDDPPARSRSSSPKTPPTFLSVSDEHASPAPLTGDKGKPPPSQRKYEVDTPSAVMLLAPNVPADMDDL